MAAAQEVRPAVLELDAMQRERLQKVEGRQAVVEGRLLGHHARLEAHVARRSSAYLRGGRRVGQRQPP